MKKPIIYLGDSATILKTIESDSINLIFTSPPYALQREEQYGGVRPEEYADWFLPISAELMRVLASDGSFVLNIKESANNGVRDTYVIHLLLDLIKQGWRWVDELVWHKLSTFPHPSPGRLQDTWERLYHLTKLPQHKMFRHAVKRPSLTKERKRRWYADGYVNGDVQRGNKTSRPSRLIIENHDQRIIRPRETLPRNVIELAAQNRENLDQHPAVFPKRLPTFFINLFTEVGDTVLDPFAGSGTALFAAYECDRHSIGIEIKEEYFETMKKRIDKLPMRLTLA